MLPAFMQRLSTLVLLWLGFIVLPASAAVSTNAANPTTGAEVGRVAPRAPGSVVTVNGAHGVTRPTNNAPLQIVTLHKGVDMEGLIQENGLAPKFRYRALNGFAAPMPEAVIQKLKADPRVLFVEADAPVKLCDRIDTLTNSQVNGSGAVRMGFDRFPMSRYNGRTNELDVVVAVLDSGIDPHEDLVTDNWFSPFSDNPLDELGHGTAVAGVIAALDNAYGVVGVTPGVRIWNIKVMGLPPENNWTNVIGGIEWALENSNRIAVANMSLVNESVTSPINTIHAYMKLLVNAGIVVVAAAGNSAQDLAGPDGVFNDVAAGINSNDDIVPASFPEVMCVSAIDPGSVSDPAFDVVRDLFWEDSPGLGSNFSQVERTNNFVHSPGGAIDVAAPGVNIASTFWHGTNGFPSTSYGFVTGTSMAAPHVAGLVALYIASHGRATNAAGVYAIRQAIINAALPQSQWRPHGYAYDAVTNNTGDPDTHPEPLAIASEDWVPKPVLTHSGAPGNFQLRFSTVPGYDYTVQSATNLTSPIPWTNVATVTGGSNLASVLVTDTNPANQNFYRLARKGLTGPPLINLQPLSATVPTGGTNTFRVNAAGVAPFNCRWHKNGLPLPDGGDVLGASAIRLTLSLTNVQPADAGDYSVVVTNSYGSVTSVVATLTVTP